MKGSVEKGASILGTFKVDYFSKKVVEKMYRTCKIHVDLWAYPLFCELFKCTIVKDIKAGCSLSSSVMQRFMQLFFSWFRDCPKETHLCPCNWEQQPTDGEQSGICACSNPLRKQTWNSRLEREKQEHRCNTISTLEEDSTSRKVQ